MDVRPSGNGTVKVNESAQSTYPFILTFGEGTPVIIEAVPAPGYFFSHWSGNLSGSANPIEIVLDCNKRITATFTKEEPSRFNWPLVGGITGVVVLAGLLLFLLRTRIRGNEHVSE